MGNLKTDDKHYGVVCERDLGTNTAKIAAAVTEYNLDPSWKEVGD